ncbi:hypothetical protein KL942_003954 [Ogataea angusta]|uniref:Acyl carrier protein n=1 Tax=Pichia angusta TaxID=870730 RepID=A0AAN6I501_PICAN|nr:uncharacterized protein KL928_004291 [Ogataea angusta]KAG7816827.1 hypothetical protein KL928_004291 [Ogataea angusta]KAG7823245.1 hypothetical protein KL909_003268 [Ogataea angusta]KAG7828469.1 hypothetical protein KL920_003606 [Ogataea angusta]KAG7838103.1 hypothetical protein KL943_000179 [Ogataea angusta]KAG7838958.1 hypothetical protein KL942_003954 [Ogataea angusta]
MLRFAYSMRNAAKVARAVRPVPAARMQPVRFMNGVKFYSSTSSLTKEDVLARSISVLNSFELKVPSNSIGMETEFIKDLGMDSLDYNDVLVALEEEFDVVFDDNVANEIKSVGECVDYVLKSYTPAQESLDPEIR